jgi:hypothetical protein
MLPDLRRLVLQSAPTDGFVVLTNDDERLLDHNQEPKVDSITLDPIQPDVLLFEMPVDPSRPHGHLQYFNPVDVWRAALANPMKAPLRPLQRDEWEELKHSYGNTGSDEDKKKMRKAERCLERYWTSHGEVVCGQDDESEPEDDEDVAWDPEQRFAHLLAAGQPAVVAAHSLEKLSEWYDLVTDPNVFAGIQFFVRRVRALIVADAAQRETLPHTWPHSAMLREVYQAMQYIMEGLPYDDGDDEDDEDGFEPDDPDDPDAWYDLQAPNNLLVTQSFDGWLEFLRAAWRLLPGLPDVSNTAGADSFVISVLDAAQARGAYDTVRNTYTNLAIVDMMRAMVNDLITRFPYLWEQVYYMAETDTDRLIVAEAAVSAATMHELLRLAVPDQFDHLGHSQSEWHWAAQMRVERNRLLEEAARSSQYVPWPEPESPMTPAAQRQRQR